MADSGCVQIGFGVESGSKLIIEQNNKNVHIERAEEQFATIKDTGVSVQPYWVFGCRARRSPPRCARSS